MNQIARWWDGIELWIIGLPYIPQIILVMAVVLPAACGIAYGFDRLFSSAFALLGRDSARPTGTATARGVR